MSKDNSGPAFPSRVQNNGDAPINGFVQEDIPAGSTSNYAGMSLRDYFAAKAMQSAQSDPAVMIMLGPKPNADKLAEYAYWVADAMLVARAK